MVDRLGFKTNHQLLTSRYAWKHTWSYASGDNSTLEQLSDRLSEETKAVDLMRSKVDGLVATLVKDAEAAKLASGAAAAGGGGAGGAAVPLPASAERRRAARLSSCVMSRLTPRLFPDRPVVSFMLQARRGGGQELHKGA